MLLVMYIKQELKDKFLISAIKSILLVKKLNWGKSPCINIPWKFDYVSENGHPLIYWEFINNTLDEEQRKI